MKYEHYMNEQRARCHRIKAPLLPHVNLTFRTCQWTLRGLIGGLITLPDDAHSFIPSSTNPVIDLICPYSSAVTDVGPCCGVIVNPLVQPASTNFKRNDYCATYHLFLGFDCL